MGKNKRHIPVRTCISCGAKGNKRDMVRIVLDTNDNVLMDDSQREPGRGAYICQRRSCLELAIKGKGLNRAFRRNAPLRRRLPGRQNLFHMGD